MSKAHRQYPAAQDVKTFQGALEKLKQCRKLLFFIRQTELFKEKELEIIAIVQRKKIISFVKDQIDSGESSWLAQLRNLFTHDTLSSDKPWRERVQDAGNKMRKRVQDSANKMEDDYQSQVDVVKEIEKKVQQYLKRSPEQDILKSQAFAWLKLIQEYTPTDAWWFPDHAIEVAHKAFRLAGKSSTTLKNYLSEDKRKKQLNSIFPGAVLCFFMCWYSEPMILNLAYV